MCSSCFPWWDGRRRLSSCVIRKASSFGKHHRNPFLTQAAQSHAVAEVISGRSTMKRNAPQWQLPRYVIVFAMVCAVGGRSPEATQEGRGRREVRRQG